MFIERLLPLALELLVVLLESPPLPDRLLDRPLPDRRPPPLPRPLPPPLGAFLDDEGVDDITEKAKNLLRMHSQCSTVTYPFTSIRGVWYLQ